MSKKSCPIQIAFSLYANGKDFFDIQYLFALRPSFISWWREQLNIRHIDEKIETQQVSPTAIIILEVLAWCTVFTLDKNSWSHGIIILISFATTHGQEKEKIE